MNRLILFVIGAICGTAATSVVYQTHIVQTKDQWLLVPRAGVTLKDVYADVRKWSLDDWRTHPELSRDMVKAGHAEIIQNEVLDRVSDEITDRVSQRIDDLVPEPHRTSRARRSPDDFDSDSAPD